MKHIFNYLERMGSWQGTILNQFYMSKENLTEPGLEPETSGLNYYHSHWLEPSSSIPMVLPNDKENEIVGFNLSHYTENTNLEHSINLQDAV